MVQGLARARRRRFRLNKALPRLAGFVAAGLAQALSIAAPWNGQPLWWLQLLSLAFLAWQLDAIRLRAEPKAWRSGFLYGWAFTTAWLCGTFWWLFISLHTYGGLAAPLAALAVFALAAALALYYAIACAAFAAFAPASRAGAAVFFAALWTLGELLRGSWFTGFPWGAGGYAHLNGPLVRYVPWLGVYGVGLVAALLSAWWGAFRWPAEGKGWVARFKLVAVTLVLLLLPTVWPSQGRTDAAGTLGVALLQGNIPQDEKFVPGGGVATALRWYGEQLAAPKASLTITPETAIPLLPSYLPNGYLQNIAERYSAGDKAAIVGLPISDGVTYSNAVLGFRPGQTSTYRYDKHHLVPFGEFVPSVFRWFTNMMNIPL
ncbi:MAG: apolipoprotein N-acyltransferase, partial [Variovorax sp.]